MSDPASSRPAPDEPPEPRPGGPADVSGLFPRAADLAHGGPDFPRSPDLAASDGLFPRPPDLTAASDGLFPRSPDLTAASDGLVPHSPDLAGSDGLFPRSPDLASEVDPRGFDASGAGFDPLAEVIADLADLAACGPAAIPARRAPVEDSEPTARTIAALLGAPATSAADLADAVAWCYDDDALPLLLPLARHPDPAVRRAVAQALPSVLGEAVPDDTVRALLALSADADDDVRDWACFALGTQLSEVDDPAVRDALAARLDDPHDDTRCEALLGLARRRDDRALPVLHERLSRDNVYSLEIDAAGALGHASLHTLVRGHLSGWDDDVVARVCAALRLTDPDGVGEDLLDGLADWFHHGAPHASDEERYWWSVTLQLLEHAEYRAPELAEQVHYRLQGAEPATTLMLGSRLAQLAGDHGWPRWRPSY